MVKKQFDLQLDARSVLAFFIYFKKFRVCLIGFEIAQTAFAKLSQCAGHPWQGETVPAWFCSKSKSFTSANSA